MKIKTSIYLFPAALAAVFMSSVLIIISPLSSKTIVSLPTPVPTTIPTPIPWQNYTDTINNISLKYPQSFTTHTTPNAWYFYSPDAVFSYQIINNPKLLTIPQRLLSFPICELEPEKRYSPDTVLQSFSFGEISGLMTDETIVCPPGGSAIVKSYFIPSADKIILFSVYNAVSDISPNTYQTIEKILSTIKFTK